MKLLLFIHFCSTLLASITPTRIQVTTAKELTAALEAVNPGDTIDLSDGTYRGKFIATRSGTADAKITITGTRNALISGYNYGFNLQADHWLISGFSVVDSNKAIVLDRASNNTIDGIVVVRMKQEAIHLRQNSADNVVQNCDIQQTGLGSPGFGEGIYIGQAVNNWMDGQPDGSDRNQVLNNHIGPDVSAECIDIKEGSCCGLIRGNICYGPQSGQNYADSAIDVKGDHYLIEENISDHPLLNGIEIHHIRNANMGGCNNIIQNNECVGLSADGKCAASFSNDCDNVLSNNN